MKQILPLFFLITSLSAFVQAQSDTIEIEGKHFYYHGLELTSKELSDVVSTNQDSKREIKKAKNKEITVRAIGYAAGFCIGYPIGTAIGGGDPEWAFLGVGVGLVLVAIPLVVTHSKNNRRAVFLFNQQKKKIAQRPVAVNLGFTFTGFKLRIGF